MLNYLGWVSGRYSRRYSSGGTISRRAALFNPGRNFPLSLRSCARITGILKKNYFHRFSLFQEALRSDASLLCKLYRSFFCLGMLSFIRVYIFNSTTIYISCEGRQQCLYYFLAEKCAKVWEPNSWQYNNDNDDDKRRHQQTTTTTKHFQKHICTRRRILLERPLMSTFFFFFLLRTNLLATLPTLIYSLIWVQRRFLRDVMLVNKLFIFLSNKLPAWLKVS